MSAPRLRLHVVELPLRRPFTTSHGSVSVRQLGIVEFTDDDFTGWGEAAPYPGQDEPFAHVVAAATGEGSSVTLDAAIDQAIVDRSARADGVSLTDPDAEPIPVSVAIGLDDPLGDVSALVGQGVGRFKLKVAPGRIDHAVRIRAEYPDVTIGIDANRSFDDTTARELEALADVGIVYLEEPLSSRDLRVTGRLRKALSVPVFADESILSWTDVPMAVADPAVDGITIKPGRLGWSRALAAVDLAETAGKLWRASGLLESGIGRAYTDALAARSPAISDVAPAELVFDHDLTASRWLGDGRIAIPIGPGVGVVPDRVILDQHTVDVVTIPREVSRRADRGIG